MRATLRSQSFWSAVRGSFSSSRPESWDESVVSGVMEVAGTGLRVPFRRAGSGLLALAYASSFLRVAA